MSSKCVESVRPIYGFYGRLCVAFDAHHSSFLLFSDCCCVRHTELCPSSFPIFSSFHTMKIFEIQLNDDDEEKYNLRFGAADEMNTEIIFWCC